MEYKRHDINTIRVFIRKDMVKMVLVKINRMYVKSSIICKIENTWGENGGGMTWLAEMRDKFFCLMNCSSLFSMNTGSFFTVPKM